MNMVVLDIDGVLADFEGFVVETLYNEYGEEALVKREEYDFSNRFSGDILDRARQLTRRPSSYINLEPIHFGISFAERLIENGAYVIFVSARPFPTRFATQAWLENHLDYSSCGGLFVGVNDKASFLKGETFEDIGSLDVKFVVDDSPRQIQRLNEFGIKAYCWSQPWNEESFPKIVPDRKGSFWVWKDESEEDYPLDYKEMLQ